LVILDFIVRRRGGMNGLGEKKRERGGNGGSPVFVTTANDNCSPYIALTFRFPITRVLDSLSLFSHPRELGLPIFFLHFTSKQSLQPPHSILLPLFHFFPFLSQVRSLSSLLFISNHFFRSYFLLLMHISHLLHVSYLQNGLFIQS